MPLLPACRALAALLIPLPAQQMLLDFPNQMRPETAFGITLAADLDADGDLDLVAGTRLLANDGSGGLREVAGAFPPPVSPGYYDGTLFDADGDGDLDVAFAGYLGNALYLQGPGVVFSDASALLGASAVWSVAVAVVDRDLDGDLELYFANVGQDQMLDNVGGGAGFLDVTTTTLPANVDPSMDVEPADVDSDGDEDLLVGGGYAPAFNVPNRLLMLAGGAFADAPFPQPAHGNAGSYLRAVDVDGDSDLDVICAHVTGLERYTNDGSGGFAPGAVLMSRPAVSIAIGDVDGDGIADVIESDVGAVWPSTYRTMLLRGDGAGGFAVAQVLEGVFLAAPLLGDIDGDQDADVFHSGADVLLNDGHGRLFDPRRPAIELGRADRFAVGDVDADGDADAIAISPSDDTRVFRNDGGFHDVAPFQTLAPHDDGALGDVDGDGDLDLMLAPPSLQLWGAGGYADAPISLPSLSGTSGPLDRVALGDVDGDGDLDALLLESNNVYGAKALWLGDGAGGFKDASGQLGNPFGPHRDVELGDVDQDGDLDVLLVGKSVLLKNAGSGSFADATAQLPIGSGSKGAAFFDADHDGDLDVATFLYQPGLWSNDGAGTFTDVSAGALPPPTLGEVKGVAAADFDGDGHADLYVSLSIDASLLGGQSRLFRGNGGGLFQDATTLLPELRFFSGRAVAADLDCDGDVDLLVGALDRTPGIRVNRTRHLQRRGVARLGKTLVLDVDGPPNEPYTVAAATAPNGRAIAGIGVLGLQASTVFLMTSGALDADGAAVVKVAVPPDASLLGFETSWQALVGLQPRFTNAERTVLSGL